MRAGSNFAGMIGLRPFRQRIVRGPSVGTPVFKDEDKMSTEETLMKRDLYKKYGARGMRQAIAQAREERMSGGQQFSQMMSVQKEENEQEKFYVGKWLDLISKARESGDTTLQKHLINIGEDYIQRLSPGARAMVEPLLRSGPFDKEAKKLKKWDEMNPAPRVTADPELEPIAYAQQLFQAEDHSSERSHLLTGKAGAKRSFIPMGGKNGQYAMRDKDGRVSIANEESLQIKDFATKFGVSEGEVIANNGAWGKSIKVVVNGVEEEHKPFTTFPDKRTMLEKVSGRTQAQYDKMTKDIVETLSVVSSGDDKLIARHPLARLISEQAKSNETFDTDVAPRLEKAFPGYTFVKPKEPATKWDELFDLLPFTGNRVKGSNAMMQGGFVESDNNSIRFIPGTRTVIRPSNGPPMSIIYDSGNDLVYEDTNGVLLGSYKDALSGIESRNTTQMQRMQQSKKKREEEEDRFGFAQDEFYMLR